MDSIVGNKEEHELENESEKSKLSEINVIKYDSKNNKNRKNCYYKIILVGLITISIFYVFFFVK